MRHFLSILPHRLRRYLYFTLQCGQRISEHFRPGVLTLAFILIALSLLIILPPDGTERAEWAQFIGRFHPLTVHFPLALLLLVPILEVAGRDARFSYLRLSTGFVLGLATLSATLAAVLGWKQHMWGGILLAAVCWLCWLLRTREQGSGLGSMYALALAIGIGLVA